MIRRTLLKWKKNTWFYFYGHIFSIMLLSLLAYSYIEFFSFFGFIMYEKNRIINNSKTVKMKKKLITS